VGLVLKPEPEMKKKKNEKKKKKAADQDLYLDGIQESDGHEGWVVDGRVGHLRTNGEA
jgi:hypothetical protein